MSESAILSLLDLHSDFPIVSDGDIIILEPYEIFSVSPIRWSHELLLFLNRHLSKGFELINVPVFLVIKLDESQPAASDITDLFSNLAIKL